MNWYQANERQADPETGTVRMPPAQDAVVRRDDAISRHLDSVEQRGW